MRSKLVVKIDIEIVLKDLDGQKSLSFQSKNQGNTWPTRNASKSGVQVSGCIITIFGCAQNGAVTRGCPTSSE